MSRQTILKKKSQNLWHLPVVTQKQQKRVKFQAKVYSHELGRAFPKYRLLKTIAPNWISRKSPQSFSVFLNSQKPVILKNSDFSRIDPKKAVRLFGKRYWFFDTAAPIPGVCTLQKRKGFLKKKKIAFQTIRSWLQVFNKKQMKALFFQKIHGSTNWTTIMIMESLYQSTLRKTAWRPNAH